MRTFSPSVFAASSFFFFFLAVPAASSVASGTHHEPSAMEVVLGTMGVASSLALSTIACACRRRPCCLMTGVNVMGPAILGCPAAAPQTCLHVKNVHNAYQGLEPYLPGTAGTTLLHDDSVVLWVPLSWAPLLLLHRPVSVRSFPIWILRP